MTIVTIRGNLGTGAPEVGKLVADKLKIDYIDRQLIREISQRLDIQEQDILAKEILPTNLRGRIAEYLSQGYTVGDSSQGAYLPFWQMPLDDISYKEAMTSLVTELAQNHSFVIHGRGGQYILKNHPGALHVAVVAPFEFRLKRVMETMKLTENAAKQEMQRTDGSYREFMKKYFAAEMTDLSNYDMVVNTANFGFENAASLITLALPLKQSRI